MNLFWLNKQNIKSTSDVILFSILVDCAPPRITANISSGQVNVPRTLTPPVEPVPDNSSSAPGPSNFRKRSSSNSVGLMKKPAKTARKHLPFSS